MLHILFTSQSQVNPECISTEILTTLEILPKTLVETRMTKSSGITFLLGMKLKPKYFFVPLIAHLQL